MYNTDKFLHCIVYNTHTYIYILGGTSPPGSYTQNMPLRSAASGLPPLLPPLLQQTVLNQDQPYVSIAMILVWTLYNFPIHLTNSDKPF